jgi:S1-C subfamily serine protease
MEDIKIIDAVERYIRGEMTPDERLYFEQLRKTNPEVDQMVVEHTLFLQQVNRYGEWKNFKQTLLDTHTDLAEQGRINSDRLKGKARVVYLWNRYKRVTAIAASIAGITAIMISALVWSISPKSSTVADYEKLNRKIDETDRKANKIQADINSVKNNLTIPAKPVINYKTGGTGFLIESNGLMITNAHVVQNSKNIRVVNAKGEQFNAFVVKLDVTRDIAVIRIDDDRFKPLPTLPYGIRKSLTEIAEPVFTLGFPRDEIVYGEGYMSARSGLNGDTLSCQIAVPANPGNSGGPVFNHNGEVIGILSGKQPSVEGAVFAVQSKYIYQVMNQLKADSLYRNIKLPSKTSLAGLEKQKQVEKISDFVFMVKGD